MTLILICFYLFSNSLFAQNLLFDKSEKTEYGIELGAMYDKSYRLSVGFNLFKIRANVYAYYLNKISSGIEVGIIDDKTIYHYIEYSSTAWIFQYGLRFNQYKTLNYRVSLSPFVGLSFFGKYNLMIGYLFTNDFVKGNRLIIGFNSILAFKKPFKKL